MRSTLLRLVNGATFAAATLASFAFLSTAQVDHPQPLTTGCAQHRVDLADSCTESDARLFVDAVDAPPAEYAPQPVRELGRFAAYGSAYQGCSAPLGEPAPGMAWAGCMPVRASLVDAS